VKRGRWWNWIHLLHEAGALKEGGPEVDVAGLRTTCRGTKILQGTVDGNHTPNNLSTMLDLSPRLIVEGFYNRWNKIGLRDWTSWRHQRRNGRFFRGGDHLTSRGQLRPIGQLHVRLLSDNVRHRYLKWLRQATIAFNSNVWCTFLSYHHNTLNTKKFLSAYTTIWTRTAVMKESHLLVVSMGGWLLSRFYDYILMQERRNWSETAPTSLVQCHWLCWTLKRTR